MDVAVKENQDELTANTEVRQGDSTSVPEMSEAERFEHDYARSSKAVFTEYAQHEIFYNVLKLVDAQSDEKELMSQIKALPQMKLSLRSPRWYLNALCEAGALSREPLEDESTDGKSETATSTQGAVTIKHYRWFITPVGSQLLIDLAPSARLHALIGEDPKAWPIYQLILDFCENPRTRTDIEKHLDASGLVEGLGVLTLSG